MIIGTMALGGWAKVVHLIHQTGGLIAQGPV